VNFDQPFTLGDYTFTRDAANTITARQKAFKKLRPKGGPIRGAKPPRAFAGIAVEATKDSPAAVNLLKGIFCGHGEPTYTVFDLKMPGAKKTGVCAIFQDPEDPWAADPKLVVLFEADEDGAPMEGKKGRVIWRQEWGELLETLREIEAEEFDFEADVNEEDEDEVITIIGGGVVAVGFEYGADTFSEDDVTWLTIDVQFMDQPADEPVVMVNAELA
jgi:hypothetical protein